MAKMGIFYASAGGNTTEIAEAVAEKFGIEEDDMVFMEDDFDDIDQFEAYDVLFIGSSTWGQGDPHFEWVDPLLELQEDTPDLGHAKVAFFGAGDCDKHGEHFCSALGKLYDAFTACGATPVGAMPKQEYTYEASLAEKEGSICGLCIDNHNEKDKTPKRISSWLQSLEQQL